METAVIKAYIHAPAERVWHEITDHEGLARFRGVTRARLLRPGNPERNGVGAQREVVLGRIRFVEDVVRFEPPVVMEYRVRECTVPLRHELGRIRLRERGAGTEIHWTTTFHLDLPVVGRAATRLLRALVCDGFLGLLLELKDELETMPPGSG
jgi:uncharacterized protein YndB with AHSA1/START domain